MRFKQRISACLTSTAAIGLTVCLFASGRPVFASEQVPGTQPQTPAPQTPAQQTPLVIPGPQLQISADEAVKMALENNLGIRAERLSPQIQALAVAQTRANYTPIVFSNTTKNSNTNPPQNFQQGSDLVTNAGLRSNAGVAQA